MAPCAQARQRHSAQHWQSGQGPAKCRADLCVASSSSRSALNQCTTGVQTSLSCRAMVDLTCLLSLARSRARGSAYLASPPHSFLAQKHRNTWFMVGACLHLPLLAREPRKQFEHSTSCNSTPLNAVDSRTGKYDSCHAGRMKSYIWSGKVSIN
jgi:hypothetical protein